MASLSEVEYGKCPCGGRFENREVEVRFATFNPPIVLSRVPQGACPICGSRVYKAQVLEYIECLMRDGPSSGGSH
jgi:hypothetical protein